MATPVADHPPAVPDPTDGPDLRALGVRLVRRLRRTGGDLSIALGALSIVTFWTFGLGIVLGVAAIGTGVLGARPESDEDDQSSSPEALFGILAGTGGVLAGAVFLSAAGPNW